MTDESFLDISATLALRARERPGSPALVFEDRVILWRDLHRLVDRIAGALHGLGIRTGDRVALLAGSRPETVAVFLGALRAGGCAVLLPVTAAPDALERMILDSDAKVLVAIGSRAGVFAQSRAGLPGLLPGGCIASGFAASGWTPLEAWVSGPPVTPPSIQVSPHDPFNILYSSGTTRTPRGILHDHRMRSFQIRRMIHLGIGPETVMLIATPLDSNTTVIALLPALASGGTVVLLAGFDAGGYLRTAERHRVTHTMLVPVQYRRLLSTPGFEAHDLSAFRAKLCTGAPMPAAVKRDLITRWPGAFIEIYGQTEGGCTTVLDAAAHPDKLASVGRPARGVDVRILDDHDREAPGGETGEIVGRAVSMMTGYYKQPKETEALAWRDRAGNVYYRTGDLGYLDEDGFLHLRGRKKDVIVSGGCNVHASDLEQILCGHPAVAEAAVIGIPSEAWGETPLALVVRRSEYDASAEDLMTWANARLGRTQRLGRLEFLPALPRNPAGKVLKRELRKLYS